MTKPGRNRVVSDTEILREIRLHPDPIVTASEVAEAVDMTPQGVNSRLNELVDEELVVRKDVGARAAVYWLTDAGKARVSGN
jgi:predicted transcriptional regulator